MIFYTKKANDSDEKRLILIILTFLNKWVLECYGYSDYFFEARGLAAIDPCEYIPLRAAPNPSLS